MKRARGDRDHRLPRPRRSVPVAALTVLVLTACGSVRSAASPASTQSVSPQPRVSLTIRYWPHGQGADGLETWTLICHPTGGDHPAARRACAELAADRTPFAPPAQPCPTVIVRGEPEARVAGRLDAEAVDAIIRPRCGTAWQRLHALLTGA